MLTRLWCCFCLRPKNHTIARFVLNEIDYFDSNESSIFDINWKLLSLDWLISSGHWNYNYVIMIICRFIHCHDYFEKKKNKNNRCQCTCIIVSMYHDCFIKIVWWSQSITLCTMSHVQIYARDIDCYQFWNHHESILRVYFE